MIKIIIIIISIIIALLIWKHWEKFKLASAGILFMIAFAIFGIGFYIHCFMSTVFNYIRR